MNCPHGINLKHKRCDQCEEVAKTEHGRNALTYQRISKPTPASETPETLTETPETDALLSAHGGKSSLPEIIALARRLERERNEAKAHIRYVEAMHAC